MRILGIIPARYGSTRFPGKPLADIGGKSMIMRVVERASACASLSAVIVATDDERIAQHVRDAGAAVVLTSPHHPSGTDRCYEALTKSGMDADAVINIQGDEPFVHASQIDALAALLKRDDVNIATLAKPIHDASTLFDPNKVKVVFNQTSGRALYFSRHAIPFVKSVPQEEWLQHASYFKHLGLYGYKTDTLARLVQLAVSPLEQAESLEQLRWLENGYSLHVAITDRETPAIDTPQDLEHLLRHDLNRWE